MEAIEKRKRLGKRPLYIVNYINKYGIQISHPCRGRAMAAEELIANRELLGVEDKEIDVLIWMGDELESVVRYLWTEDGLRKVSKK
jgi:hypothetical protein